MKQLHSFGQVFLTDVKYIQKIFNSLDVEGGQVLEIGPGKGVMSELLADLAKNLYCVEVDQRFCKFLRNKFSKKNNVEIINQDILKFQLSKLGRKIIVFGNVPYHISSELIKHLINCRKHIEVAYFTLQKEFVEKMVAKPSSDNYNFFSCYIQYYAKVEKLFEIKASAFDPVPKVDSAFSKITFYSDSPYKAKNEDFLFKVIRKAFSSSRKKMANALNLSKENQNFFKSVGLDLSLRPENFSLEDYVVIANQLYQSSSF